MLVVHEDTWTVDDTYHLVNIIKEFNKQLIFEQI